MLAGEDYRHEWPGSTAQLSIAGSTSTLQSVQACARSAGGTVNVSDDEAVAAQKLLGRHGLYAELSSASGYAALIRLVKTGDVPPSAKVTVILTSHGYKDPC